MNDLKARLDLHFNFARAARGENVLLDYPGEDAHASNLSSPGPPGGPGQFQAGHPGKKNKYPDVRSHIWQKFSDFHGKQVFNGNSASGDKNNLKMSK